MSFLDVMCMKMNEPRSLLLQRRQKHLQTDTLQCCKAGIEVSAGSYGSLALCVHSHECGVRVLKGFPKGALS